MDQLDPSNCGKEHWSRSGKEMTGWETLPSFHMGEAAVASASPMEVLAPSKERWAIFCKPTGLTGGQQVE